MVDDEVLTVRFHFNGDFVVDGSQIQYCNRGSGVSHIEKDKLLDFISMGILLLMDHRYSIVIGVLEYHT
jgi:hypothetical protein